MNSSSNCEPPKCAQTYSHCCARTAGRNRKVIIFCTREIHADRVAQHMNNFYVRWCRENGKELKDHYAFKCMGGANNGAHLIESDARLGRARLHRLHRGPAGSRCRHRAPECRGVLSLFAVAHQVLPDGRARHAHPRRNAEVQVLALRLHRRHPACSAPTS
jgi:hypothetical protein